MLCKEGEMSPAYPCRTHPERDSAEPIALRLCDECLCNAHAAYANYDAAREAWHETESPEETMRMQRGRN